MLDWSSYRSLRVVNHSWILVAVLLFDLNGDHWGPACGSPPSTTLVPPQAPAIDVPRRVKSLETLRLAWIGV